MKLHAGEQYDFFYIAENKKWQLMTYPATICQPKDTKNGKLPELIRPRTAISFENGNSRSTVARLGEEVMKNRLIEGLNLTNEALENSGANFLHRMRGLKQIIAKESWTTLGDPAHDLRDDPTVQGWRDNLKADGVYYEGTEDGKGSSWVRRGGAFSMVATGSIDLPATVMRHQLGQSMGLRQGGRSDSYSLLFDTKSLHIGLWDPNGRASLIKSTQFAR